MKWLKFILLGVALIIIVVLIFKSMSNPKELNSLTEQDARAVQVAVGELQERNIVIEGYEVNVVIRGETTIVIFVPSDWKAGMPGSSSDQLSYEVKLTSDLQTLSVTAVR